MFFDRVGYDWIDSLRAYAAKNVSDLEMSNARHRFPINTPTTKEAFLYRSIFASHFPSDAAALCVPYGPSVACSTSAALAWDASFKQLADCSGRSVDVHHDAYKQDERNAIASIQENEHKIENTISAHQKSDGAKNTLKSVICDAHKAK